MKVRILLTIFAISTIATPSLQAGQNQRNGTRNASCYSSLLSAVGQTLSAYIESMNPDGAIEVNGSDTQQPDTPFQFAWGDGSTTSGFFPQLHNYPDAAKNYVIAITATENNGSTQKLWVPVFFVPPSVREKSFPDISFQIPST
ncbi:MAG: hypothetical protein WCA20_32630, partial [Candidatus Sulfotelmatobacter sp.]